MASAFWNETFFHILENSGKLIAHFSCFFVTAFKFLYRSCTDLMDRTRALFARGLSGPVGVGTVFLVRYATRLG